MDATAEWELIARCRNGHARVFEPLVLEYERPAVALARGILGDVDEAEDAVQDAFVQASGSPARSAWCAATPSAPATSAATSAR